MIRAGGKYFLRLWPTVVRSAWGRRGKGHGSTSRSCNSILHTRKKRNKGKRHSRLSPLRLTSLGPSLKLSLPSAVGRQKDSILTAKVGRPVGGKSKRTKLSLTHQTDRLTDCYTQFAVPCHQRCTYVLWSTVLYARVHFAVHSHAGEKLDKTP